MSAPISKNAMKRLIKEQKWAATAGDRQEARKVKKLALKERKALEKASPITNENTTEPERKRFRRDTQVDSGISVIIDLDFESYMTPKELVSTVSQLGHCYSANNTKFQKILDFSVCSFGNALKSLLLTRHCHYINWKHINLVERNLADFSIPGKTLCYLTPDSPNVLQTLEKSVAYVIGGIVDKNRHKGLCLKKAEEMGLAHARLPIGEFIQMSSRKVLTINHVFEIMGEYVNNSGDWKSAFLSVVPERKNATGKKDCPPRSSPRPDESNQNALNGIENQDIALTK